MMCIWIQIIHNGMLLRNHFETHVSSVYSRNVNLPTLKIFLPTLNITWVQQENKGQKYFTNAKAGKQK